MTVVYPGALGDGNVAEAIGHMQHHYTRLWALFNQDRNESALVRDALAGHYPVLSDSQLAALRVVLYDTR